MQPRPALFLDRDGVVIEEVDYLSHPGQVVLIRGAAQAIALVNRHAIPVIVATNQAGVARGYFPESNVALVHEHLNQLLAAHGAHIDRYYYCPHHPTEGVGSYARACACRKPQPGMLLKAAAQLHLDLEKSWLVGDKLSDLQAGIAAGCQTILVETGYGRAHSQLLEQHGLKNIRLAKDLAQAVDVCLVNLRNGL
jgi:D-glycero-D-manno-heptose 1,7-bisphosphate phosphatase